MELKEITNKEDWEGFLSRCAEKTFLQSWNWGEYNKAMGNPIWRFGAHQNGLLVAVALILKVSAKRGTFLFIPHGPIFEAALDKRDKKEIFELMLIQINGIAKEQKASFVRISPLLERTPENEAMCADLGLRESPMHSSAYEATWKLDIYPDKEDLLKNMRKTTRYVIKKEKENKDISIEISSNLNDVGFYQELTKEVSKRQKFVPFSPEAIKNEFDIFAKDNEIIFLFGKHRGEMAAGAMVIFWSGIAFYHQAASIGKFAKFSIPYLLQWRAIQEAKNRNCSMYDFWGFTDPEKFPKHPWAGPTLFKMGFGGYKREYVKTQDFIISKKYWINYIIETIRKRKRNL